MNGISNDKFFNWAFVYMIVGLILLWFLAFIGCVYSRMELPFPGPIANLLSYISRTFVREEAYLLRAGLWAGVLTLFFALLFVVHAMKARRKHLVKSFIPNFILFPLSFAALTIAMVPVNFFFLVVAQRRAIEECFQSALTSAQSIYPSYQDYAQKRLNAYERTLSGLSKLSRAERDNRLYTLGLQLFPPDFEEQARMANEWIQTNLKGPSVLNPFLITNTETIKQVLTQWNQQLEDFSTHYLRYESGNDFDGEKISFSGTSGIVRETCEQLDRVINLFSQLKGFSYYTLYVFLPLYLLLLLPYKISKSQR